ncbi:MAG: hypothetical protein H0X25_12970 [Acidobacteriales bacterium]|nr:hypothetical protein [Terriglobales bacterium]
MSPPLLKPLAEVHVSQRQREEGERYGYPKYVLHSGPSFRESRTPAGFRQRSNPI